MNPSILITVGLIAAGCFTPSTYPADSPKSSESNEVVKGELGAKLDDYLTRMTAFGFAGTALVAKDGVVVLSKGYGLADRERGIPNTNETAIDIGSITKQFTAAAILKLEMQGKLSSTDRLSKFFSDTPPDKAGITLHQLLTHSAGLASDFGEGDYEKVSREEYVKRIFQAPLLSKPGEQYHYSNAGFSLLAAIIERLTNGSYEKFLRENLLIPAQMFHTGYVFPQWSKDAIAHGYEDGKDWGTAVDKPWAPDGPYWLLRGNGGILSTVDDMYKWHLALAGERVLSREALRKYQTPYVREGPSAPTFYAYGWSIANSGHGKLVEHNGGNGIFHADFLRYVEAGEVVYIASNATEINAIEISHQLAAAAFGDRYVLPPKPILESVHESDAYAGTYLLSSGGTVAVKVTAAGLEVTPQDPDSFQAIMQGGSDGVLSNSRGAEPEDLKALSNRTAHMLTQSQRGEYKELVEAFHGDAPTSEIENMAKESWAESERRWGKFKGVVIIGTARSHEDLLATLVRVDFERGSEYLQYTWEGGWLNGVRRWEVIPGRKFLPESSTNFAAFRVADGTLRISFRVDNSGRVSGLIIRAKNGDITAQRQ